jgi:hypothetical protein
MAGESSGEVADPHVDEAGGCALEMWLHKGRTRYDASRYGGRQVGHVRWARQCLVSCAANCGLYEGAFNVQAGVVDNVGDVNACGLCIGMVDEQATAVGWRSFDGQCGLRAGHHRCGQAYPVSEKFSKQTSLWMTCLGNFSCVRHNYGVVNCFAID